MVHCEPMSFPYRIMNSQSMCPKSFTNEQVEIKIKDSNECGLPKK